MLLEHLTDYCDKQYQTQCICGKCPNDRCTHDEGCCPQPNENKCELCLRQVHYHDGRQDYDCEKIVNYYVCRYAHKYASEVAYSFNVLDSLSNYSVFNILSIGCGPASDLMAFEKFNNSNNKVPITYWGFDINPYWKPIHREIEKYCNTVGINTRFKQEDAIEYVRTHSFKHFNILVMEYVISHFINTKQFDQLSNFFTYVAEHIVANMEKDAVVIIQDANHYKMGRDEFIRLARMVRDRGQKFKIYRRYFDFNISSEQQKYGEAYPSTALVYKPSKRLKDNYCSPRDCCGGVQLLLKLEEK